MNNEPKTTLNSGRRKSIYIAGAIGIIIFLIMLALVLSDCASPIDDPIRQWFYSLRRDGLNEFISVFTLMGNWQTITAICIALLIIPGTRLAAGVPASAGALMIVITNKILKTIIRRLRPDDVQHLIEEGGFSFPSGHSIDSMFFYGLLLVLVLTRWPDTSRAWRVSKIILVILLIVLTFGIGLSRIYLGVHYPTDVLAGWSLGVLGISVTLAIIYSLK